MGINTIHDTSEDIIVFKNVTKQTCIRGEFLNAIEYARREGIKGLPNTKFNCVIRCNGWCNVSEGDFLKTPLSTTLLKVVKVQETKDNKLQFKRRTDASNFVGTTDIFLE